MVGHFSRETPQTCERFELLSERFEVGLVASLTVKETADWVYGHHGSQLLLPPIQRSAVWRNDQIINYWDSLLRGYPPSLMMVHRAPVNSSARNLEGSTVTSTPQDFHLFDGQQRLTAILLGLGAGQLKDYLKLWVNFGESKSSNPNLLFQLRISSSGQPFGYQGDNPNAKHTLEKRRSAIKTWLEENGREKYDPVEAFNQAKGTHQIDSERAIPLEEVTRGLRSQTPIQVTTVLKARFPSLPQEELTRFVLALDAALNRHLLFQLVDEKVVEDPTEYFRFFDRLGRGGTALSNDELTYSIIKHRFPEVHEQMKRVTAGAAGRFANEVNIVLGALRLAKAKAPMPGSQLWERAIRPGPTFVEQLEAFPEIQEAFTRLIPASGKGKLVELLEWIRARIEYDPSSNPTGLPRLLLARMPHQLLDVLLLLAHHEHEHPEAAQSNMLAPFALYWVLFVSNQDKAANRVFRKVLEHGPLTGAGALGSLVREFEQDGSAWTLPNTSYLEAARPAIERGSHRLRIGTERFHVSHNDFERQCAEALNHLTTHRWAKVNALSWAQRAYLSETHPHYDPTRARDEDLPFDRDHIIPWSKFDFHWKSRVNRLAFEDVDENFRWRRGTLGNSLGNLRWLDASDNRSRKAAEIDESTASEHIINCPDRWNHLIRAARWGVEEVGAFQKLIELRSLDIVDRLLIDGRLGQLARQDALVPPSGKEAASNAEAVPDEAGSASEDAD